MRGFVAFEAFLQPIAKLIPEHRSNMPPLEASRCSNDAPGETFYAARQVCLRIVEQFAFDLTSLGLLLRLLRLTPRLIDLALDDGLYLTQGSSSAHVAECAFQIGS